MSYVVPVPQGIDSEFFKLQSDERSHGLIDPVFMLPKANRFNRTVRIYDDPALRIPNMVYPANRDDIQKMTKDEARQTISKFLSSGTVPLTKEVVEYGSAHTLDPRLSSYFSDIDEGPYDNIKLARDSISAYEREQNIYLTGGSRVSQRDKALQTIAEFAEELKDILSEKKNEQSFKSQDKPEFAAFNASKKMLR